jgi:hypothetical protein
MYAVIESAGTYMATKIVQARHDRGQLAEIMANTGKWYRPWATADDLDTAYHIARELNLTVESQDAERRALERQHGEALVNRLTELQRYPGNKCVILRPDQF